MTKAIQNTEVTKFEAYGTMELAVSTEVMATTEATAEQKALLEMSGEVIVHAYLTVLLPNGSVKQLKVHNVELLNGIESLYNEHE